MALQSFKDFLKSTTLTFIDIDETLFRTFAKIHVVKNGRVIKKLDNQEFNTYKLKDGESFDFREFKNANLFKRTSLPIQKTIKVLQLIYKKSLSTDSDVYLLTARADFDDRDEFIKTLRSYGIPAGKETDGLIHVLRAGNLKGSGSAERKKKIIRQKLNKKEYSHVTIFDDDLSNINAFLSLAKDFPNTKFSAFIVKDGNIKFHSSKNDR